MPSPAFINIYKLASWARSTIVPLLVVSHHQPIYSLPNSRIVDNDFLDELWRDPTQKVVPYAKPFGELWRTDGVAFTFAVVDRILFHLGGFRSFFLRGYARRKCVDWILDHQEMSGDWAGIFPPMHVGLLALV